jgi:hypothetical protein
METRRSSILEEIIKLTPLCSGTLYEQRIPCGKKNCRCHDKESPILHGPYYVWVRRIDGRQVNRTLCPGLDLERIKAGIENYNRFQTLLGDILRSDEESVLADRSAREGGKKNSGKRYRKH